MVQFLAQSMAELRDNGPQKGAERVKNEGGETERDGEGLKRAGAEPLFSLVNGLSESELHHKPCQQGYFLKVCCVSASKVLCSLG